jgi:putative toxin-antitoxin system antitoxin component (TIGR02293 family)
MPARLDQSEAGRKIRRIAIGARIEAGFYRSGRSVKRWRDPLADGCREQSQVPYSNEAIGRDSDMSRATAAKRSIQEVVAREISTVGALSSSHVNLLDELLAHGFSREELFRLVIPRRTLTRRLQAGDRLSLEESDRALRLARITAMAERVFAEEEKAHRWLRKPSPMLEGSSPLELLRTEAGAHLVEQALHRIDYGMLA